jgi:adenylate cyclase, class 2
MERGRETEAKFYVRNLADIERRLRRAEASLFEGRTLEVNLRFDTPDGRFQREGRLLRLRRDEAAHLTFKDGGETREGAVSRREIEFGVSDFDSAREFIEALGYEVVFIYEKYRTTYGLKGTHVMLDETPMGDFVEIEGELEKLRPLADSLGLDWEAAVPASYHALFERVRKRRGLAFRDLRFEHLTNVDVAPGDLGVRPADN